MTIIQREMKNELKIRVVSMNTTDFRNNSVYVKYIYEYYI